MKNYEEILQIVTEDDEGKYDEKLNLTDINVSPEGLLDDKITLKIKGLKLSDWATHQFCSMLGIPTRYYKSCPNTLKETNANYWIKNTTKAKVMLRCKGDTIRGIVSEKYSPISNRTVVESMGYNLKGKNYQINDFKLNEHNIHMRLTFPDLTKEIGKTTIGTPDNIRYGTHIMNSEIGASSISVVSLLYRLICSNGLIRTLDGRKLLQQRHIHIEEYLLNTKLNTAMESAMNVANDTIEGFIRTRGIAVLDPKGKIKRLCNKVFPKDFVKLINKAWDIEPEATLFGVINAFTRAAKELEYDKRLEVEEFAGRLIKKEI